MFTEPCVFVLNFGGGWVLGFLAFRQLLAVQAQPQPQGGHWNKRHL